MLKNNQIIPVLFAAVVIVFTGCSKSDDENVAPKKKKKAQTATPKTAAEIKAETIAEFEKIIGDGIGGNGMRKNLLPSPLKYDKMTTDEWDKHPPFRESKEIPVFKFSSSGYEFRYDNIIIKGSVFDLKKENGIFTISADTDVTKTYGRTPAQEGEKTVLLAKYTIETKAVEVVDEMYEKGEYIASFITRFDAVKPIPESSGRRTASRVSFVARQSTGSTGSGGGSQSSSSSFSGIQAVNVKLVGQTTSARLAAWWITPSGSHHVKFTPKTAGSDTIRVQFCDASGNISGNATADYNYNTTHHFWKNKMPMSLNLDEVYFVYSSSTNDITKSNIAVMARAKRNSNPNGYVPSFLSGLLDQNSGSSADIITTTGNSASDFKIEIKLGFSRASFHCIIED